MNEIVGSFLKAPVWVHPGCGGGKVTLGRQVGFDFPVAQHLELDPLFPLQQLDAGVYAPPPGQHFGVYFVPHCFVEAREEAVCA